MSSEATTGLRIRFSSKSVVGIEGEIFSRQGPQEIRQHLSAVWHELLLQIECPGTPACGRFWLSGVLISSHTLQTVFFVLRQCIASARCSSCGRKYGILLKTAALVSSSSISLSQNLSAFPSWGLILAPPSLGKPWFTRLLANFGEHQAVR